MKLLAAFVFAGTLALAQAGPSSGKGTAICPLSDAQVKKSMEAFAKIVPTLTGEPRCANCHGGVNPFIEDPGKDPDDPLAPPSKVAHGPGAQPRSEKDCNECHSKMAPKTGGEPSNWMVAPPFLSFVGKDAPTLCKQIKDNTKTAEKFIKHVTDDDGGNNFTGTAFNGDRGLDREMYSESEVPTQKPRITHGELMRLGSDWVATTGGEFKGDPPCGCEPAHYAIRITSTTAISMGPIHFKTDQDPVDVPITFSDDGTFTGEATAIFQGAGIAYTCSGQSVSTMKFRVSGKAIEVPEGEHSMHIQIEDNSPEFSSFSGQCPDRSVSNSGSTTHKVDLPYDMVGNVEETLDKQMPVPYPGVVAMMHLKIVKRD